MSGVKMKKYNPSNEGFSLADLKRRGGNRIDGKKAYLKEVINTFVNMSHRNLRLKIHILVNKCVSKIKNLLW